VRAALRSALRFRPYSSLLREISTHVHPQGPATDDAEDARKAEGPGWWTSGH
jgi:hypothetical protein